MARCGRIGKVVLGRVRYSSERYGMVWSGRIGTDGQGEAALGEVWTGRVRQERLGMAV